MLTAKVCIAHQNQGCATNSVCKVTEKTTTHSQQQYNPRRRWFGALITVAAAVALVLAGCKEAGTSGDNATSATDTTAPTVSDVQTSTATATTATITATVNEAGKLFWVVYVDGADKPANAAALITDAGKVKTDPIVANSGSAGLAVSAAGNISITITGLTENTSYDLYAVAQDAAGNSSVLSAKVAIRTTDATAPTVSGVQFTANGTSATITATVNEAGKLFWVVYVDGTGAPANAAALITDAGKAKTDPIVANSSSAGLAVSGTGTVTVSITGITASTNYDFYAVAQDAAGNNSALSAKLDIRTALTVFNPTATDLVSVSGATVQLAWTNPDPTANNLSQIGIRWGTAANQSTTISSGLTEGGQSTYSVTGLTPNTAYTFSFIAGYADSTNSSAVSITRTPVKVDGNNNTLIDISTLDMLNNIRCNLTGTTYLTADSSGMCATGGLQCGTAGTTACTGYELMRNLDFATAGDYASGTINTAWRPSGGTPATATNAGWVPIGTAFASTFEGNDNTISNLYVRSSGDAGLFHRLSGTVRNLGVINGAVYGRGNVGVVVAHANSGSIVTASYTSGTANGGARGSEVVGGLIGLNNGIIIASYAITTINVGAGTIDNAGGLVGSNAGTIIASYATGDANGGIEDDSVTGGLVGTNNAGTIIASYATGDANVGAGTNNSTGGLVGNNTGTIIASYATGDANGGIEAGDTAGGLVGNNIGTSYASYATGDANGGAGANDIAGSFIGDTLTGTITAGYGFGTATAENAGLTSSTPAPASASAIAGTNAGCSDGTNKIISACTGGTLRWVTWATEANNAWNLGTSSQPPALKYADYDGAGTAYNCNQFPAKIPGTNTPIVCGTTLLPGQGR